MGKILKTNQRIESLLIMLIGMIVIYGSRYFGDIYGLIIGSIAAILAGTSYVLRAIQQ